MSLFDFFRRSREQIRDEEVESQQTEDDFYDTPYSTHAITRQDRRDIESFVFHNKDAVDKMIDDAMDALSPKEVELAMDATAGRSLFDTKAAFSLASSRIPDLLLGWYARQGFIGYQTCAILAQHWLINKACETPPKDACRNGWELSCVDETIDQKILTELQELDNRYKVEENVLQFSKMTRVFGIRIAIFKVESEDPRYYEIPFNIDSVGKGKYLGVSQVDPYWCVPEITAEDVSDPGSITFYEPEYWVIGGIRYHKSHLCIRVFAEVPDVLKPAYLYGGVSLTQMIYERVYCAERSANEAPQLLMTKRMNVQKVNMEAVRMDPNAFKEKAELSVYFRDNYGTKFIGKDEDYTHHETSLADSDAIIMSQYQLVASIAGMPATRLIEMQPKGFNTAGDNEQKNYRQLLKTVQIHEMTPLAEGHYRRLLKSEYGISSDALRLKWRNTDDPTTAELADLNLKKAEYYQKLQESGAIEAKNIAESLNADETSGFNDLDTDIEEPDPFGGLPDEEVGSAAAKKSDGIVGDAEFKEHEHPRDEDGKFTSGGGGSSSNSSKTPHDSISHDLSESNIEAIIKYANPEDYLHSEINTALRENKPLPSKLNEIKKSLDNAMSWSTVKEDITVYRGVDKDFADTLSEGKTFKDDGFVSTSTDPDWAENFTFSESSMSDEQGALLEIRVKKGLNAISMNASSITNYAEEKDADLNNEDEIILNRGYSYKVISEEKTDNGLRKLVVEVIK